VSERDATNRVPVTLCWHCDRMLDAAHGILESEGEKASPGAISLCLYCGAIAIFGPDLEMRRPTRSELDVLAKEADFRQAFVRFNWARQFVMIKSSLMRPEDGDPDR
jgi:hypothetical protein